MKKEVLVAIAVGFGLGLIITFGIWTANKSLKQLGTTKTVASPLPINSPSPTPVSDTPKASSDLIISSPENEALVNKSSLTVTGKFLPNSAVAITYEDDETVVETDSGGNFSADIVLIGGYNTIVVTGIDLSTGVESSQTLIVTYTTAKI